MEIAMETEKRIYLKILIKKRLEKKEILSCDFFI